MHTEDEYQAALDRLNEIFDAEEGTAERAEANILVRNIEEYEDIHYPIKGSLYD